MDMKNIVQDLVDSGMSEAAIARELKIVTQPTIHRIKTGEIANTSYLVGFALVELHREVLKKVKRK